MHIKLLSLKKHFLTLIIASCFVYTAQANPDLVNNQNFDKTSDEWVLLKEVSGIKVYYKINKCESTSNLTDPLKMTEAHLNSHETFGLKFVNENTTSTSISFSKITTTDGTDEMQTISISSGTTIIDSCESTAKLILTRKAGDKYPTSITAYLQEFKLTTNYDEKSTKILTSCSFFYRNN